MNEGRDSEGGRYQLTYEIGFINQFVSNLYQPRTLLDVCCGSGSLSSSIHRSDFHTIGLDIDFLALNRYRQLSGGVSLTRGDALCMPFAEVSIDCIIALHCFDHLNRIQFLQECNRVLSDGGFLIFESLNRNSYKWALKRFLHIIKKDSSNRSREKWINIFSCREVLLAANYCGFDVQAVYGYNWIPFTQASNCRLIKPAAFIERALHMDRFFMISPRFLVVAKKRDFQL
jgi:2-polyprenyl-3-methyl-5-hydroxy-6-metoxy-1,4-benzoquinol methylase